MFQLSGFHSGATSGSASGVWVARWTRREASEATMGGLGFVHLGAPAHGLGAKTRSSQVEQTFIVTGNRGTGALGAWEEVRGPPAYCRLLVDSSEACKSTVCVPKESSCLQSDLPKASLMS